MRTLTLVLSCIGASTIIAILACLILVVLQCLDEVFLEKRNEYRYKHRFDKKPTAKCYCVDCKYRDEHTDRCYRFKDKRFTDDDWFCCDAAPRSVADEEKS